MALLTVPLVLHASIYIVHFIMGLPAYILATMSAIIAWLGGYFIATRNFKKRLSPEMRIIFEQQLQNEIATRAEANTMAASLLANIESFLQQFKAHHEKISTNIEQLQITTFNTQDTDKRLENIVTAIANTTTNTATVSCALANESVKLADLNKLLYITQTALSEKENLLNTTLSRFAAMERGRDEDARKSLQEITTLTQELQNIKKLLTLSTQDTLKDAEINSLRTDNSLMCDCIEKLETALNRCMNKLQQNELTKQIQHNEILSLRSDNQLLTNKITDLTNVLEHNVSPRNPTSSFTTRMFK